MSIASELNNYRNGLEDAYDAVSDMSGTIPTDRNMNNLDAAIRTIPISSPNDGVLTITQNGTTVQTFSANQATNVTAALTDTTYSNFVGTDGMDAGTAGLVPAPATTDVNKYLSSDGSWASIADRSPVEFYWYNNDLYTDNMMSDQVDPSDVANLYEYRPLFIYNPSNTSNESVVSINGGSMINAVVMDYVSGDMVVVQYRYDYGNAVWTRLETNVSYSNFTGATSSAAGANGLVPAPAAGDQEKVLHGDGTWKDTTAKLVEMSYGESNAWAKFIAAYNAGSIVYCRASSNSNPGTGSQTRKAFMAYVNNAASPTNVEFQYVRSQSSKTDSQQCDQVFVYTLTNASGGTWSVATRNMAPKINVSGPITKTFTNGANATLTLGADAMTGATSSADGAAGVVPKPNSGDQDKFLKGDGTWAAPATATASDYLSFSSGITVNDLTATKFGPIVKVHYDIGATLVAGENVVGTATSKVAADAYGAARVIDWGTTTMGPASIVVIPSGAVRIYTSQAGTASAGDVWFFEA